MDERKPTLDDPAYAAFAWGRYKRLMWAMAGFSLLCVGVALGVLWWNNGPLPLHMIIATTGGVFFTAFLTAALMGLVFLSSGTGHDEQISDPLDGHVSPDD